MKITALFFGFFPFAEVAQAQEWGLQYLAMRGGHPIPVERGEHQYSEAYYRTETRAGLYIRCGAVENGNLSLTTTWLRVVEDQTISGHLEPGQSDLFAQFDEGAVLPLGTFRYGQGSYDGDLPPTMLARMMLARQIVISNTDRSFEFVVPLAGFGRSVAEMECEGRF